MRSPTSAKSGRSNIKPIFNLLPHVAGNFVVEFDIQRTVLTACEQAVSKTCKTYTSCCVYSIRLLMMDRKPVRNMQSSIPKINFRN